MKIRNYGISRNTKAIVCFCWTNGDIENVGYSDYKKILYINRYAKGSFVGVWQPKGTKASNSASADYTPGA